MQRELEEYQKIQVVINQLDEARQAPGRRTITKKLALTALNTVNTCSVPPGEGRGAYV